MNKLFSCWFFAETEAADSWKRDWETLKRRGVGRQKLVWITGHLSGRRNPLIQKGSETFSHFLLKSCPRSSSPPPSIPLLFLCSVYFWESVKAETGRDNKSRLAPLPSVSSSRDRSFLCVALGPALTHWLFYLMWNSTRSAEPRQLLPQQNNKPRTPLVPVSLSLFRLWTQTTWATFLHLFNLFVLLNHLMR